MEPASIRYKNPGAMWGGNAISKKWGEAGNVSLNDGTGQGNKIAVFPTYVQGICAQLDLWRSSKHYKNKPFSEAIKTWSGGNHVESYIKFVLKRVPGMERDTIMNDAFWKSPMGISFLKAQAWHEAGKPYPAPDADWVAAQQKVMNGVALPKATVVVAGSAAAATGAAYWLDKLAWAQEHWVPLLLVAVAFGVFVDLGIALYKNGKKNVG